METRRSSDDAKGVADAAGRDDLLNAGTQLVTARMQRLDHGLGAIDGHRRESSSEPDMLCAVRCREQKDPFTIMLEPAESHDLAPSCKC